jgi:hypothetical protein
MEVMIMPLYAIPRVEPVTAPTVINTYTRDEENSPFFNNYIGRTKAFLSNPNKNPYNTLDKIVYMEKSVQENLGHHLNIFG